VGHSLCYAQAIEALTDTTPDAGARIIRTIALELERLQNHVGDLGALSGDVAFLPPANYCGRMRGDFLNMSLLAVRQPLSARDWCDPGGSGFP
jgi:Ni,Fe-hydrogenase III large subunit